MVMSYLQVILEASMACSWLPLVPLLIVLEKREREWLVVASQLYVLSAQLYITSVIMKINLPRKGAGSAGHVFPFDMI